MLNLLNLAHSALLLCLGHLQRICYGHSRQKVENISATNQVCRVALTQCCAILYGERGLRRCVVNLLGTIISHLVLYAITYHTARVVEFCRCNGLRIEIHHAQAICGQRVYQLELRAQNILHAAECLEMHLANGRNNAYCGVYKVANLLYVAHLLCAHLNDKYLMMRFQVLAHGADNAQRCVEITRCHQHIVSLREYAVEVVLCRGLAEATRNADNLQVGHRAQDSLCIVIVPACDSSLQGLVHKVCREHYNGHNQQRQCHRRGIVGDKYQCRANHRCRQNRRREEQSLNTHRIYNRLLVHRAELLPRYPQHNDYCRYAEIWNIKNARNRQRRHHRRATKLVSRAKPTGVTLHAV